MIFRLSAVAILVIVLTSSAFAQELDSGNGLTSNPDDRTAQALFEDANGYLGRR